MSAELNDPVAGATPSHQTAEATPTEVHPGHPGLPDELGGLLDPPQAGDELGRLGGYRVLRVLGHGGMGVVFEAEEVALARRVALKLMRPQVALSEDARRRFVREAQAAAATADDHIVPIFGVGEVRGVPFLAMPLLPGESLAARLARERHLPVTDLVRIGRDVAAGLAAAHAAKLVHRDIKPANLWLEAREPGEPFRRVRVLDFGLARPQTSDGLTATGALLGTPAYMSPEQVDGRPLDGRSDLFALGCVLYRAATGCQPFDGPTVTAVLRSVADHRPQAPKKLRPELPGELSDLIQRLLEKSPERRPASAAAVGDALRKMPDTPATPARRPVAWAAGVLIALTLGVTLTGLLWERRRPERPDDGVAATPTAAPEQREGPRQEPIAREVEADRMPPPLPGEIRVPDSPRAEIDEMAKEVAANLKALLNPVDTVVVGDFTGPATPETSGGAVIAMALSEALKKHGVRVARQADVKINGEYEDVKDTDGKSTIQLSATCINQSGKKLFECQWRGAFGKAPAARTTGVTTAPAGPMPPPPRSVSFDEARRVQVDGLAKEVAANLKAFPEPVDTVAVGDATLPASADAPGRSDIVRLLTDALVKRKLRVDPSAATHVAVEYGDVLDMESVQLAVHLAATCTHRNGKRLFECRNERTFAGNYALRIVLDELARDFALSLRSLPAPVASVAVGDFTGPAAQETTGGDVVAATLTESLRRYGVKVARQAEVGIKGEFGCASDADSGRLVIHVLAACKGKGGRTLFEFHRRCPFDDSPPAGGESPR